MKKIEMINGRRKVSTVNNKPEKTQQQFKDAADINNIIKKAKLTGDWPVSTKRGAFLDNTNLPSYQDALHMIISANSAFEELPSSVRKRFQNDPHQMIAFLEDPDNEMEARKLGLLNPLKTSVPTPTLTPIPESSSPTSEPKKS